ncbi:MAG: hypothetical protein ACPG4K_04005 [Haloferula sp.]
MSQRALVLLGAAMLIGGSLAAQESTTGTAGLEDALQQMLSERESPEKLANAIKAARQLGGTEQAVLEARFLYHVDLREDAKLVELLPELEKQAKKFRLQDSEIFAVEEDWLAVLEYVRALSALQKNDKPGFKEHITEAFWLSPQQGAAFAPHIERLRLEEHMQMVKVDFSLALRDFHGTSVPLQRLSDGKKAILLHFFSPWSRECEESLPDFAASAGNLEDSGIAVVSIISEALPEAIADTTEVLAANPGIKGAWLIDDEATPLSRTLRIQSAPTMVLVELDGSVRFNGHPSDDGLWKSIKEIAPDFVRPAMDKTER